MCDLYADTDLTHTQTNAIGYKLQQCNQYVQVALFRHKHRKGPVGSYTNQVIITKKVTLITHHGR